MDHEGVAIFCCEIRTRFDVQTTRAGQLGAHLEHDVVSPVKAAADELVGYGDQCDTAGRFFVTTSIPGLR